MKAIKWGGESYGKGIWVNPPDDKLEEVQRTGTIDGIPAVVIDVCPYDHGQGQRCPDWPIPCTA